MTLNSIQSNSTWGKAASDINTNFTTISADLEKVKNATTKNKGYFKNDTLLKQTYKTATVGDIAYVGTTYPYQIWEWNGSTWANSGATGGSESVNLNNYVTKEELTELEKNVGSNRVAIGYYPNILYSKAYESNTGILQDFDTLDCTELIELQDYKNLLYIETNNKVWYEIACFDKEKKHIGRINLPTKILLEGTKYFSISFLKDKNIDYSDLKINLYSTLSSIKDTRDYPIGFSPNVIGGAAYGTKTGILQNFDALDCTELIEAPNGASFVNLSTGPIYEIACFDKDFSFLGTSGNQRRDLRIGVLLKNTKYFSISFLKESNIDYTKLKLLYSDFTYRLFSSLGVNPGIMKSLAYNSSNGYLQLFELLDCTPLIEIPDYITNVEYVFSSNKEYYQITCLDDECNLIGAVTSPANSIPLGSKYFSVSFLKEKSIDYNSLMISLKSSSETTNGLIIPVGKAGKKYYLFGDSITYWDSRTSWYDPEVYMVAYPSYIRDVLGAVISNRGIAGERSDQITNRLVATDLSDAYAVTYMAGSNDIQQSVPIGELGTLNTSTYIGNLEKGLQYVLQNYPQVKFYFISPPYFKDHNITPYCEAMQQVAEAYAIPIIRWDLIGGINKINTDYYTVEGLHPNNLGHKLFADKLIPFLQMY